MRVVVLLVLLSLLAAPAARASDAPPAVAEDADFDPYSEQVAPLIDPVAATRRDSEQYAPKSRPVESFDFDPSEGLTFFVAAGERECFFQDAKSVGDALGGAYVVSSADSHIDLEVKNPEGATIYRRLGDAEGQYEVHPSYVSCCVVCYRMLLERVGEVKSWELMVGGEQHDRDPRALLHQLGLGREARDPRDEHPAVAAPGGAR